MAPEVTAWIFNLVPEQVVFAMLIPEQPLRYRLYVGLAADVLADLDYLVVVKARVYLGQYAREVASFADQAQPGQLPPAGRGVLGQQQNSQSGKQSPFTWACAVGVASLHTLPRRPMRSQDGFCIPFSILAHGVALAVQADEEG